jgi:hypothetical protein
LPLARIHLTEEDYAKLRTGGATAIHAVWPNVIDPILATRPALKAELEQSIERCGVLL